MVCIRGACIFYLSYLIFLFLFPESKDYDSVRVMIASSFTRRARRRKMYHFVTLFRASTNDPGPSDCMSQHDLLHNVLLCVNRWHLLLVMLKERIHRSKWSLSLPNHEPALSPLSFFALSDCRVCISLLMHDHSLLHSFRMYSSINSCVAAAGKHGRDSSC